MKNGVNKEYTTSLGEDAENRAPSLYQVVLHHDDFTPKEFVLKVLQVLFYLDRRSAAEVMMEARTTGKAICGMFSKDFAEAKVSQVEEYAKEHEHPLLCSVQGA